MWHTVFRVRSNICTAVLHQMLVMITLMANDKNSKNSNNLWKIYDLGKSIPLEAWTGPEGSRSLRLLDFTTIGT